MSAPESPSAQLDAEDPIGSLRDAARLGRVLDLAPDLTDDELAALEDEEWPPERTIDAGTVRAVLRLEDLDADPQGLRIRGARITGTLDLSLFDVPCPVRFLYCSFATAPDFSRLTVRELDLTGSRLLGMTVANSEVKANLVCERIRSEGAIVADGLRAGGSVFFTDANLRAEPSLVLMTARIEGDIDLSHSVFGGEVLLRSTKAEGRIFLVACRWEPGDDDALTAEALDTDGLELTGCDTKGRALNLAASRVGNLAVLPTNPAESDVEALPGPLTAPGWSVGDFYGAIRTDRKLIARWLDTVAEAGRGFTPQTWHRAADVYERNGHDADARWLRYQAARRTTRSGPLSSKLIRYMYGAVSGYGYYPLVAALWLIAALVAAGVLVERNRSDLAPARVTTAAAGLALEEGTPRGSSEPRPRAFDGDADCASIAPYPCLRPTLYAMDTVLPSVATGQADAWRPNPVGDDVLERNWLPWTLTFLKAVGWAMTAILLAGLTGLLRRT